MPIHKGQVLSEKHRQAIREGIARKLATGWKPDTTKARAGLATKQALKRDEKAIGG